MRVSKILAALLIAGCAKKPAPQSPEPPTPTGAESTTPSEPPPTPETAPTPPTTPAVEPVAQDKPADTGRRDFTVPTLPTRIVVHGATFAWTDRAGATWTMPVDGSSAPKQISEQHRDGFAAHPFVAGNRVLAKAGKGVTEIAIPDGPVTRVPITGIPALVESAVANATDIFMTLFSKPQVLRVASTGGAAKKVIDLPRAVLALHGETLYLASYTTGNLIALPVAGGAPRTITTKLKKPTALAVDGTAAYVYTEGDQRMTRIDLATGTAQLLADQLNNSDEVVLAGPYIYTVSWPNKLVRIPTTAPGSVTVVAEDLVQPRGVVVVDRWIYVASDKPARIVRVPLPTP